VFCRKTIKNLVSIMFKSAFVFGLLVAVLGGVSPAPVDAGAGAANGQSRQINPGPVPDGLTADEWGSIQEQMLAAQYQFTWQVRDGRWAYRAANRAQGFSVAFAADCLQASGYASDGTPTWAFGLALTGYGAPEELSAERTRVAYQWSRALTEWYENRPDGVEHGLTLAAPPPGTDGAEVELTFALRGNLIPYLDASGQALRLQDTRGDTVLRYDHLRVCDAGGRELPARLELVNRGIDKTRVSIVIDAAGAAYPLTVAPLLHSEAAILRASDAQWYDYFGYSVSISGDTIIVGAKEEDGGAGDPLEWAGAAYVFARNQGGADHWGQVTILRASDAQWHDEFGRSVSISGDTLVVGALYEDGGAGDPLHDAGAAYVFERNQGGADNWGEAAILRASDAQAHDHFGQSVSISGDTIVVGAYDEDGGAGDPRSNAGAAYVFERNQGGADNWGEAAILRAYDAQAGDYFGYSVSISGDTLVVGAWYERGGAGDPLVGAGAAYVFERNEGGADNWGEAAILRASDAQAHDHFGESVSISGDTLVVGAWAEDGGAGDPLRYAGAAYVFARNQGGADTWGEAAILRASDAQAGDEFGWSVSISGDTIVVGVLYEDGGAGDPCSNAGAAYVFERNEGGADNWGEAAILRASDAQAGDEFGWSVSISGDTIVVGAPWAYGGAGDPLPDIGAAYVFTIADPGSTLYLPLVYKNWPAITPLVDDEIPAIPVRPVTEQGARCH
jgi:hypothetical protein